MNTYHWSIVKFNSLIAIIVCCISFSSLAQSNDDCLMCHQDKDLTGTKNDKNYSVFVNTAILKKSLTW